MGKLKPKDRPHAGFRSEDGTARALKRQGHKVEQVARNSRGHDLKVNGKKVEVKAAVKTSYKGSDGYPITGFVFSNLKVKPDADRFVLKCMSPDRKRVLKQYEIPASQVKQKTLTITDKSKYEQFRKKAFLASHPQPARMNGAQFQTRKKPLRRSLRQIGYKAGGAAIGTTIGAGIPATIQMAKVMLGDTSASFPTDFKTLLKASIGGAIGMNLGKVIEETTYNGEYNEQARIGQRVAAPSW